MTGNFREYQNQNDRMNWNSGRHSGMSRSLAGSIEMRRKMAKIGFSYLFASLIILLFGAVYEHFSFGVYSNFMLYAFAFPLIGGVFVFFGLAYTDIRIPDEASRRLYHCAVITWTVGSIFQGILDIYGTTNVLIRVYWIAGALLMAAALIRYALIKSDGEQ